MPSDNIDFQNERPKRPCEFTFTWSIHNYSSCTSTSENDYFESPEFVVDLDGKSKCKLFLYPRGFLTAGFLGCYVEYTAVGEENVQFTLSVRKSNGQFQEGVESLYNCSINTNGLAKLVPLEKQKCPACYLVNGSLTVRFRMWGMNANNPISGECDVHSRIKDSNVLETFVYQANLKKLEVQPMFYTDQDLNKVWTKNMQQCYKDGKFCDFVIQTPNQQFPVHRSVLATHSSVFDAMFERDMEERKSGTVNIEDVEDDTVSKMLMYIYSNTFDVVDVSSAIKLYSAADKYGITTLQKMCSKFLILGLDVSNVCDILEVADAHHDLELKAGTRNFIQAHAQDVTNCESWKKLKQTNLILICETMEWCMCNPDS